MTFRVDIIPISLDRGFLKGLDVEKIIQNTLTQTAKAVKVDFEVTTQTWKNRPKFVIRGNKYVRIIKTSDPIYFWVNGGTKAHTIRAKTKGGLRFRGGYKAKTAVKQIMSRAGGSYGNFVKPPPMEVRHPGTKARKFDETIGEKYETLSKRNFERALLSQIP